MNPNKREQDENKLFRDRMAFEDVEPLRGNDLAQYYRWRGCKGKQKLTEVEALATVTRMVKRPTTYSPETLNYYPCEQCGWWHVGHFQEGKIRNGKTVSVPHPTRGPAPERKQNAKR